MSVTSLLDVEGSGLAQELLMNRTIILGLAVGTLAACGDSTGTGSAGTGGAGGSGGGVTTSTTAGSGSTSASAADSASSTTAVGPGGAGGEGQGGGGAEGGAGPQGTTVGPGGGGGEGGGGGCADDCTCVLELVDDRASCDVDCDAALSSDTATMCTITCDPDGEPCGDVPDGSLECFSDGVNSICAYSCDDGDACPDGYVCDQETTLCIPDFVE
jgi:hypothetical protein